MLATAFRTFGAGGRLPGVRDLGEHYPVDLWTREKSAEIIRHTIAHEGEAAMRAADWVLWIGYELVVALAVFAAYELGSKDGMRRFSSYTAAHHRCPSSKE
jgi:hypothetical protein